MDAKLRESLLKWHEAVFYNLADRIALMTRNGVPEAMISKVEAAKAAIDQFGEDLIADEEQEQADRHEQEENDRANAFDDHKDEG